jgi:hypothetical protein
MCTKVELFSPFIMSQWSLMERYSRALTQPVHLEFTARITSLVVRIAVVPTLTHAVQPIELCFCTGLLHSNSS